MRDYAKVSPKFWTGDTGQELARRGSEALLVGLYLMTSPHSNMLGLYYQPVLYMAEETGLSPEGASKGLRDCIEAGFCQFDEASKMVWVIEMASYQIGSALELKDKRCKGIQKEYNALPNVPFLGPFFDRYQADFHLEQRREFVPKTKGLGSPAASPLPSPSEGPSKPRAGTGTGAGTEQDLQGAAAPLSPAPLPTAPAPQLQLVKAGPPAPATSPAPTPAPTPTPSPSPAPDLTGTPPGVPPCPLKQLVALFASKVTELPKPRIEMWKDSAGAEAMRQRWKWLLGPDAVREDNSRYATSAAEAVEWFGKFFDTVAESDFLTGREPKSTWKPDLAWLMKRENFMKVVQGNYDNEQRRRRP